jgi:hypothetical protein
MGCQYLDDVYELYWLGALEGEEFTVVREHVERRCPYCLEHLREAALTVYLCRLLAPPARLGPKSKARLLSRLRRSR